ncbi:hypothetical protein Q5741_16200 [Paenibacillus sp. JX-17]|uniref:Uncharacterized protein n=1 Tax=Paenibacillus lacisoli TaxID=3064525 RepID=A0ABT9CFA7_9BACL|nr:hypothetical protein [Paenibacillus sp. JX-17]MDO7907955.1 hypothetical protein [Paenibacillus sp. JX-17]
MDNLPLIANLLAVPEYKAKYLDDVNQLVDHMEGIQTRISGLAGLRRLGITPPRR